MLTPRRSFLTGGAAGLIAAAAPGAAFAAGGLAPDSQADQSAAFAAALAAAARAGKPLLLGPGRYRLAEVALPDGAAVLGIAGQTRLVAAKGGVPLLRASGAGSIRLEGLVLDGASQALDDKSGLVMLESVASLHLRDCAFVQSPAKGLVLQACGGRIEASRFSALETAIYANDSTGLTITGNEVVDCTNNGILVHRSAKGFDGSIVSGNRIAHIGAVGGGLGWYGNGINVYRAGQVLVSGNSLTDCAFTFIRANSGDGVQIIANNGRQCGETGIYCEFSFEGAVIGQNMIEGAANGIAVVNFDKGGRLAAVTGNVVRNAFRRKLLDAEGEGYGTGIAIEADTAASGNVVELCPTSGFALGYGNFLRDVALTGNVIRQCGAGVQVTVAKAAGNALISANVFSGCADGAVVGYEWEKKTTGDLAASGATAFPGITIGGNSII